MYKNSGEHGVYVVLMCLQSLKVIVDLRNALFLGRLKYFI